MYLGFQVPLWIPILSIAVLVPLTLLGLAFDPVKNGIGILLVLTSVPVYVVFISWRSKPRIIDETMSKYLLRKTVTVDTDTFLDFFITYFNYCFLLSHVISSCYLQMLLILLYKNCFLLVPERSEDL